jgi:hypothetical protein
VVLPAGAREHGSELRIRQRAGQRQQSPGDPDDKDQTRMRQRFGDVGGRQEDGRPQHGAHGQRGRVEEAELALQAGF